jgi:hypothetical protein
MSLAGLGCVKTRSTLNRDRRKTALIAQPASEFNLEVEMKILFSSRFGFSSFYTARVIFGQGVLLELRPFIP